MESDSEDLGSAGSSSASEQVQGKEHDTDVSEPNSENSLDEPRHAHTPHAQESSVQATLELSQDDYGSD